MLVIQSLLLIEIIKKKIIMMDFTSHTESHLNLFLIICHVFILWFWVWFFLDCEKAASFFMGFFYYQSI